METATHEPRGRGPGRRWVAAAVGAVLVLAAFTPVLRNGFVDFDDGEYLVQNGWVRQGLSWDGVRWALATHRDGKFYWHPLTWLSFMLDVDLFGFRPETFHAVNLAIHGLGAVLLALALARMTGRPGRSAAAALLFAVHPLQVEAVAWAVERKTVLASSLGFLAHLAYAWYAERPTRARWLAVLAPFTLSLLAKPMLVTLPALLLVLDVWPLGRTPLCPPERAGAPWRATAWGRLVAEKLPLLAAGGAIVVYVRTSFPWTEEQLPLGERVANALTSYWAYLGKLAWPARLAVYYPNPAHTPTWIAAAAAAGLAIVTASLVALRRRIGWAPLAGWCWFAGTMVPMAGIVRNGLWPAMADRFMYFPMVGLLVALVWAIAALTDGLPAARAARGVVLGAALAVLAVAAHVRARAWSGSLALFGSAVEVTPPSKFMWANYGKAIEAAGRADEARAWWERMIRVLPDAPDGYVNLGALRHAGGDLAGAETLYREALARDARCGAAHFDLALLEKRRGDLVSALAGFERARALGFTPSRVLQQIADVSSALGRADDAARAWAEVRQADPLDWRSCIGLARLAVAAGRGGEAEALLREAAARAERSGELEEALRLGATPPR